MQKIDYPKLFLWSRRIPRVEWQAFVAGSAWNENLESLLVDCCDSIPLLVILVNHLWNSFSLAFPAFVK